MGPFLAPILTIVTAIIGIYMWVVILYVVVSWLLAFGVLSMANHLVRGAVDILDRLTEPVLRPIRRVLPRFGGLDLSPVVLILVLWLVQMELGALYLTVYRL
jgi:YggT family protein